MSRHREAVGRVLDAITTRVSSRALLEGAPHTS